MSSKATESTPQEPQTYWAKALDLPVFDSQGKVVRTLRLQTQVEVYEVKEGLGRIDTALDQWVKLSDFSLTEPETPLVQHEFTSRPPKVELTRPDR